VESNRPELGGVFPQYTQIKTPFPLANNTIPQDSLLHSFPLHKSRMTRAWNARFLDFATVARRSPRFQNKIVHASDWPATREALHNLVLLREPFNWVIAQFISVTREAKLNYLFYTTKQIEKLFPLFLRYNNQRPRRTWCKAVYKEMNMTLNTSQKLLTTNYSNPSPQKPP